VTTSDQGHGNSNTGAHVRAATATGNTSERPPAHNRALALPRPRDCAQPSAQALSAGRADVNSHGPILTVSSHRRAVAVARHVGNG